MKDRQLFSEITQLNVYVFDRKIKNFEQHIIDIFLVINFNQNDDELDEDESLKVVNSIDIFSQQQLQSMIVNYLDELWAIFETLWRDWDRDVIAIRTWNLQIEDMKVKISNHNKEKYEINETLRVVKIEVFIAHVACNEIVKVQRVLEDKKKQRKKKKIVASSNSEDFSDFNIDEEFDFKNSRSKFKRHSFKHFDLFIFFEHKNSNTLEYIRYDIWKNKCIDKLKINFDWYVDEFKEISVVIDWTRNKLAKHIDIRRETQRNFFAFVEQIFKLLDDIYIDVDHLRNIRRQYDDLKIKFIELFNEFYFEFLLLANQLTKKNETNKIHDLEEKITIKLQHVDVELNDFEILENYFRKLQIMNNKHRRIKNNDVKINNFSTRDKSTINQLNSRIRRNEKYIANLKIRYTTLLKKKTYKIVIAHFNLKKNCRKCDKENHWWRNCSFDKSFDNWVNNLIKQKMLNLQIIFLINDNSSSIDDDNLNFDVFITFDVESKN